MSSRMTAVRGLLLRSVTIVDDAGHDAVAIEIERACRDVDSPHFNARLN